MSTRRAFALLLASAAGLACAPASRGVPSPSVAVAVSPPPPSPPPPTPAASSYWQPIDAAFAVRAAAPPLPVGEGDVAFDGDARARWDGLPAEARRAVLERGFALVTRKPAGARVGEAYAALRDARVPYVITLDALFWLVHVARDRALASVEERLLAPALATLLLRLEQRLAADAKGAHADLVTAYGVARGVVAVARALASPAYVPTPDLARVVAEETRRIEAHAGAQRSALLGTTIDYSQIVPRGAAADSAARASLARVSGWLALAPLALAGRGEAAGAEGNVGAARVQTRAALLLARGTSFDVDADAAHAWHRLASVAGFVSGAADDASPRELLDAAMRAGIDARDPASLIDTAKLDHLRHALIASRAPHLDDGVARGAPAVRVLPPRDAPDAELLQSLVFPRVGALDAGVDPLPASARNGVRALPCALDVAAWLGADDARAAIHDARDDAYAGYDAALRAAAEHRAAALEAHESVYASSLDALATYLAPSAADAVQPGAAHGAWRRRKIESTLAAWATLRHDALDFARFPTAPAAAASLDDAMARATDVTSAFVEPHPEAIAKLVALVRQIGRGLRAVEASLGGAAPLPLVDEVERLLASALAVARHEAGDEPLDAEARAALAAFPARLHALEHALIASHADELTLAVDVHTDLASGRALVEACGDLDELYALAREPRTGRLVLAVGVASSRYELTVPMRDRLADTAWRARLHGPDPPSRDGVASSLRFAAE